jgi:ArsR family transcriptional regulator
MPVTKKSSTKPNRISAPRRTAILKALADPKRFQLFEKIAKSRCPLGCAEALTTLAIAPATLSHHIKELESAGLIRGERRGKFVYLSLNPDLWSALLAFLAALTPTDCGPASTTAR